jgi:hypothetical protein
LIQVSEVYFTTDFLRPDGSKRAELERTDLLRALVGLRQISQIMAARRFFYFTDFILITAAKAAISCA